MKKRIVVTGMGVITPLGNNLENYFKNLIKGKSGIKKWESIDTKNVLCKIGGDLGNYNFKEHLLKIKKTIPENNFKKAKKIFKTAPFATKLTILSALEAIIDSNLLSKKYNNKKIACILAGHNLNNSFIYRNTIQFLKEPEYIDGMTGVVVYDTDPAASIAEILDIKGHVFTVGGTCSSSLIAMMTAMNKIRYEDFDISIVIGAAMSYSPMDLQALTMINAISYKSFNNNPKASSRPYDKKREGFVPSHGAGSLIFEKLEHSKKRNAKIYCELLGVSACSDGNHLPNPSKEGQVFVMQELIEQAKVKVEDLDYINAHATSTPLGDITEINSIKEVLGNHSKNIKVNATKSMIGHTGWSSGIVETVAAILQMKNSILHPSINIDKIDESIDIDICKNSSQRKKINLFMKNSFGFGGFNTSALFSKYY